MNSIKAIFAALILIVTAGCATQQYSKPAMIPVAQASGNRAVQCEAGEVYMRKDEWKQESCFNKATGIRRVIAAVCPNGSVFEKNRETGQAACRNTTTGEREFLGNNSCRKGEELQKNRSGKYSCFNPETGERRIL
jgi:hypothetical protein